MQPQRVRIEGGYRMKGKTRDEAEALLADARAAESAGAFGLLLELVQPDTARRITQVAGVPTIGIGSGVDCDGQVLVTHDLIGMFPWFRPKFAKPAADVAGQITAATGEYLRRVKSPAELSG
jgi:3-methyl-2-oxobutanoate hydroxymethyltransferase